MGEKGNSTVYYYCSRSGYFVSRSSNKRHLKSQGSAKINAYCTSAIVYKKKMGYAHSLEVEYCDTHYGHSSNLGHLRLHQTERQEIAGKLFEQLEGYFKHSKGICFVKSTKAQR